MSSSLPQFNTTLSLSEMETLIRRIVKEAVHEEFARLLEQVPSVAGDWAHEGPDDPAGDQLLLAEGLAERERYRTNPEDRPRALERCMSAKRAESRGSCPLFSDACLARVAGCAIMAGIGA